MIDTQEVIQAQQNQSLRDMLISRHSAYICQCASKASGRWVDPHDDLYSIAMIAFNDAITAYTPAKGSFSSFSFRVIKNRVIDHLRRERRHTSVILFSSLVSSGKDGSKIRFDTEDSLSSDTALEIASLKQELELFGISFFDLPKASPKSAKTKRACTLVIEYIATQPNLLCHIRQRHSLPVSQVLATLPVSEKLLERHRKYIIAGILITSGDYTIMAEYFHSRRNTQ